MMQSCASSASSVMLAPIFSAASKPWCHNGQPSPRITNGTKCRNLSPDEPCSATSYANFFLCRLAQPDALGDHALSGHAPQGDEQLAGQRHDHQLAYILASALGLLPASGSGSSVLRGWRLNPGTRQATSQFDKLSSITAISVRS